MTTSTTVLVWVWHILAGALGVILSLGAVYQWLERKLNRYKQIDAAHVAEVISPNGEILSDAERLAFIESFNRLTDMGKLSLPVADYRAGWEIRLTIGERYFVVEQGKFMEVMRIRRNGRKVYFRLYDDPDRVKPPAATTSTQSAPRE